VELGLRMAGVPHRAGGVQAAIESLAQDAAGWQFAAADPAGKAAE